MYFGLFYYQSKLDVKQFGLEMLILYFGSSYFPSPFILSGALSRYFLTLSLELEDFSNFPLKCLSGSLTTSLMFFLSVSRTSCGSKKLMIKY